jgi:hypothetical protein
MERHDLADEFAKFMCLALPLVDKSLIAATAAILSAKAEAYYTPRPMNVQVQSQQRPLVPAVDDGTRRIINVRTGPVEKQDQMARTNGVQKTPDFCLPAHTYGDRLMFDESVQFKAPPRPNAPFGTASPF